MMKILKTLLLFFFYLTIVQSQTSKSNKATNLNNISVEDSSAGKIRILNSSGSALLEINDEASGGSISLPPLSTIGNYTNKLYNLNNMLYWNNSPIGQSITENGWSLNNGNIVLSDSIQLIGIGTVNPQYRLHVKNGSIFVEGEGNWFPGLIINNEEGRSVLNLQGTTSSSNSHSAELILGDLTTGSSWRLLNTNSNALTIVSHSNATNYASPIKIEFGAPTNSLIINSQGNIGLGASPNEHKLAVAGSIISEEIVVMLQSNWPDFVFADEFELPTLCEVEKFIKNNHHLKGIPSEMDIKKEGIDIADIQIKLLQKIEELTLYIIKQDKDIKRLKENVDILTKRMGKPE